MSEFKVGDRVAGAIDLSAKFFRTGTIQEVYAGVQGYNVKAPVFYAILWDGETIVSRNHMAVGLKLISSKPSCDVCAARRGFK